MTKTIKDNQNYAEFNAISLTDTCLNALDLDFNDINKRRLGSACASFHPRRIFLEQPSLLEQ